MATTTVLIPGRAPITGIPGSLTASQVINMYGSEITGLRNMESTTRTEGDTTIIEFRQRTGTKGKEGAAKAA